MFSNLRNGSLIYVLRKEATPRVEVDKVVSIVNSPPSFGQIYSLGVDITTETTNFKKIPSNVEIADFGNNIVIASSKEAMSLELLTMKRRSEEVINSVEQHLLVIAGCEAAYKQLNPEIILKEEESKALRNEINELKELVKQFIKNGNNN